MQTKQDNTQDKQVSSQPKMVYKVTDNFDNDFITTDEQEAKNTFLSYIADKGDGIRLYEAEVPEDDTDEFEWDLIDSFDNDDSE